MMCRKRNILPANEYLLFEQLIGPACHPHLDLFKQCMYSIRGPKIPEESYTKNV